MHRITSQDAEAVAVPHHKHLRHDSSPHVRSNPEWKPNLPAELAQRIRSRLELNKKLERLPGGAIREVRAVGNRVS
eukprot:9504018-Pyramimonas_sp.AAC.2